jgi:hypothetical protein
VLYNSGTIGELSAFTDTPLAPQPEPVKVKVADWGGVTLLLTDTV